MGVSRRTRELAGENGVSGGNWISGRKWELAGGNGSWQVEMGVSGGGEWELAGGNWS